MYSPMAALNWSYVTEPVFSGRWPKSAAGEGQVSYSTVHFKAAKTTGRTCVVSLHKLFELVVSHVEAKHGQAFTKLGVGHVTRVIL